MRKAVINLVWLTLLSLGLIMVLVLRSEPDKRKIDFSRNYSRFAADITDTLHFPGKVSLVKAVSGYVFGYVYKQGTVYRYDMAQHRLDTFARCTDIYAGAFNGFDIDAAQNTFYGFTTSGKKIFAWQPDGHLHESIACNSELYVKGIKGVSGDDFLIQTYDAKKIITQLKRVTYRPATSDSVIYTFPQFDDGGISEDGFFVKQAATGDIYFIPFYNAAIVRYNEKRHLFSTWMTIDSTLPANKALRTPGGYVISSKALLLNSAAAVDSNYLYVVSYALSNNDKKKVTIDVYATTSDRYEGSLSLPAAAGGAVVSIDKMSDTLFVSSGNNVLLYKLQRP